MEIYEINYLYNARNCGCFTFWILFPGETFRIYYASKRLVLLLPTRLLVKLLFSNQIWNEIFETTFNIHTKFVPEHSWFLAEYFVFLNNFSEHPKRLYQHNIIGNLFEVWHATAVIESIHIYLYTNVQLTFCMLALLTHTRTIPAEKNNASRKIQDGVIQSKFVFLNVNFLHTVCHLFSLEKKSCNWWHFKGNFKFFNAKYKCQRDA